MRRDIAFTSGGLACRGWLYPGAGGGKRPAVVISHGFSAVKEQRLDAYAERFAAEGFAALVFDYRYLGASEGAPRGRIIPQLQHDDLRAALDFITAQEGVDPARIGLWGSSYSGGHALFLGALDPRVKVIVAQVPAVGIAGSLVSMAGRAGFADILGLLADDHAARNAGAADAFIPVVAPPGELCFLSSPDSHDWFIEAAKTAPNWVNAVTLESVARATEYVPAALIDLIAPKPLLIQAAETDALIPLSQIQAAVARAGEPKKLEVFAGGHFDLYDGPLHALAIDSQVAWWKAHL